MIYESASAVVTSDPRGWLKLELRGDPPQIGAGVLDALEIAAARPEPIAIVSAHQNFAMGADLKAELIGAMDGDVAPLQRMLVRYQRVMQQMRFASKPIVAGVRGVAVSGGCEVVMHCAGVVAHEAAMIFLFEPQVGIVPGGGGLKELARRANGDAEKLLSAFERAAFGRPVAAPSGKGHGYLRDGDVVIAEQDVESAAGAMALALAARGYAPPKLTPIPAGGEAAFERLAAWAEMQADATAHQRAIAVRVARILTAVDLKQSMVSEDDLLALERQHFLELICTADSRAMARAVLGIG